MLFLLVVVYAFNFVDRQIVGILAGPIKAALRLSDTQLGLMGGLAFALFYTGLGVPIAALADRKSRTWVMTAALALWSGFTAACGLAGSFWQLFAARMGVGVGEAGGVAPAYSLISDYFPLGQRARALAIYSFGIPIGSAAGIFFGGWIAATVDWRTAFFVVGLAGLALAPLFRLTVREPVRAQAAAPTAPLGATLARLARAPSFWGLSLGAASSSILGYGLAFWLPSFFQRTHQMPLLEVSRALGAVTLVGGVAGIWIGGWLADRLARSGRKDVYALVPAASFLLSAPAYVAAVLAPTPTLAFLIALAPQALALAWLGPVLTAVQHLAPASSRTTASAAFLFVNNLIGIGFGTLFFGLVSDAFTQRFGDQALRYAILAGLGFYLLASALLALTARRLARDWVD